MQSFVVGRFGSLNTSSRARCNLSQSRRVSNSELDTPESPSFRRLHYAASNPSLGCAANPRPALRQAENTAAEFTNYLVISQIKEGPELKQLLWRLVLRRLRVKLRDQALCCRRDMRLVSNYNILRRDFLPVDSLVCVIVRSDGRTLERNASK